MTRRGCLLVAGVVWSAALLLAACGGGGGGGGGGVASTGSGNTSTVYAADPIAPGDECAFGGVRIYYGIDENGNGELDVNERDGSDAVCNGAGSNANPVDPPAGPGALYAMNLAGGQAQGSTGGQGGSLTLTLTGSGTGHVKLFSTGSADASFEFPANVSTYVAFTPLEVPVDGDVTVLSYPTADDSLVTSGEFHTHQASTQLYKRVGSFDYPVTGISVGTGATLSFVPNFGSTASIQVSYDIRNEGTITTEFGPENAYRVNLTIACGTYYGAPGSQILLNGYSPVSGDGGAGGSLYLLARNTLVGLWPYSGAIYNQGGIDTSGGDSVDGTAGGGGAVSLFGNLAIVNTGDIDTSGGDAGEFGADGGSGGWLTLNGYEYFVAQAFQPLYAYVFNSGTLDTHGGNGAQGAASGPVNIIARGNIRNAGDILGYAGDSSSYIGGTAGDYDGQYPFVMEAYGGGIVSSGDIDLHGGDGGGESAGGGGGELQLTTNSDSSLYEGLLPAGSIVVSGDIDTHGGDAAYGNGGESIGVSLTVNGADGPAGQEIQLLGYDSIDLSGGLSDTVGGNAGNLFAYNFDSTAQGITGPAGGIFNYVPVKARGGDGGSSYSGGSGGAFELLVAMANGYQAPWQKAVNYAAVDVSGGFAYQGGDGGAVEIIAPSGAENHGSITANGGNGQTYGGAPQLEGDYTGYGGVHLISSHGMAINTGTIQSIGGYGAVDGSGYGGPGGIVELVGTLAIHTGALISARGGDITCVCDSSPGEGGTIYLWSRAGNSTVSGDFEIAGGSEGEGYGDPGVIIVDGMNVTEGYLP